MAQIIMPLGVTCLGVFVGWLLRYVIRRFEKFTVRIFGSLLGVILGGAIVKFLSVDSTTIWYYPVGLLLGVLLYQLIVWITFGLKLDGSTLEPETLEKIFAKNNPTFLRVVNKDADQFKIE